MAILGGGMMKRTPQFFFARQLRQRMTFEEKLFWNALREQLAHLGHWRRQVPLLGYIVDFCCHEHKLIIEIDGSDHISENDLMRDQALNKIGYQVLRYQNRDIKMNMQSVMDDIFAQLPPPKNSVTSS